jgi:acyl-CoA synthetase (NDP forming)
MKPFFYPRAVAVVGVSQDTWKFGSATLIAIQKFAGSRVPVYPVSPRITGFQGQKVYASIADLPPEVDLVIVCLPAGLVPDAVRQCIKKGIPSVEVPSGGFREVGTEEGKKLEAELASLAGQGTRIIGPNCFGVYSPGGSLTILPGADYPQQAGSVGFFAQSGAITEDFCSLSQDYSFNISQAVSYGNASDVNEFDMAQYFLADSRTTIAAAYMEGLKSGSAYFETIKQLAAKKPTVILKGGLTAGGARAAASHTGSLAGNDRIWEAFFKQTNAVQAYGMEDLLDTISAFYHLPPVKDNTVAVVCGGGGPGVIASDACSRAGLTLAKFDAPTLSKLASILPPTGASPHNPVDCDNPFPRTQVLNDIMETLGASGNIGSIIVDKITLSVATRKLFGYDTQVGWKDEPWLEEIPVRARSKYKIPVVVVLREGGEALDGLAFETERRRLHKYYQENGVPVYSTVQRAATALGRVAAYYRNAEASR